MELLRVTVAGAAGRMGQEVLKALSAEHGFQIVSAVDPFAAGKNCRDLVGPSGPDITILASLDEALKASPKVVVDFSNRAGAFLNAKTAFAHYCSPVIGATGMDESELDELRILSDSFSTPGIYVPNFAVGAVLMMRFAAMAAKWLPDAEIIEMHHNQKVDAPSGTAIRTAQLIAGARSRPPVGSPDTTIKAQGARGGNVDGVPIHSVRLSGYVAHQEVLFGGTGEVLSIRHDSLDRTSFMPGVRLACRMIGAQHGFHVGLETFMD